MSTDTQARRSHLTPRQRLLRALPFLAILGALAAAVFWISDLAFGVHGPSHYVSVINDTEAAIDWSCSWSDLRLAPGETGELRILDQPDQDYGCVPQPTTHHDDICPSLQAMTDGARFTATELIQGYRCP